MNIRVLVISALFVAQSRAYIYLNECTSAKTCGECIQIGLQCVWCKDPDFKPSRCDYLDSLIRAGCSVLGIENPRGTITIDKNKPVSYTSDVEEKPKHEEITQIQPQKLTLTLRSGEVHQFTLTLKRAEDDLNAQPVTDVIMENSQLPEGVFIYFISHCKPGKRENGRKCSNVSPGEEVKYEVTIISKGCPSNGSETIKINPLGFNEEVEIVLNFICECECHKDKIPNSPACADGNGTLECGICRCNEGRLGRSCECSRDEAEDLDAYCRMGYGADICSNNGECVCGTCECKKRDNPEERYSGKFCECDNFNCERSNNKLCGGHGRCECGVCVCDPNYAGSACDCPLDTSTCMASNKQICNGQGICECGECRCTNSKFQGSTCEICPTCPGVCTIHKDCVQCRAFQTGDKKDTCEKECRYFNLNMVKKKEDLPQPFDQPYITHCKERDANGRWFFFTYALNNNGSIEVLVAETEK